MKIHSCKQGTEEWLLCRKQIPTASNFDKILTSARATASRSIGGYIDDLISQAFAPDEEDEFQGSRWTERGKDLEPQARAAFVQHTGHAVEEVGFVTMDDLTAGCSPDGLITCEGRYVAGLEIKCLGRAKHARYVIAGVLPDEFKQQVHGSLVVTGLPEWHFWAWHPKMAPLHVVVTWDCYTQAMAAALREFTKMYTDAWRFAEPKLTPKQ